MVGFREGLNIYELDNFCFDQTTTAWAIIDRKQVIERENFLKPLSIFNVSGFRIEGSNPIDFSFGFSLGNVLKKYL